MQTHKMQVKIEVDCLAIFCLFKSFTLV